MDPDTGRRYGPGSLADLIAKDRKHKAEAADAEVFHDEQRRARLDEFDRLSEARAFGVDPRQQSTVTYTEGRPSADLALILASLREEVADRDHSHLEGMVITWSGRVLGHYSDLAEERRRENEKLLRLKGLPAALCREEAMKLAERELSIDKFVISHEMAADVRLVDRLWRRSDGSVTLLDIGELPPPQPLTCPNCGSAQVHVNERETPATSDCLDCRSHFGVKRGQDEWGRPCWELRSPRTPGTMRVLSADEREKRFGI
jgi:hypothetical protein